MVIYIYHGHNKYVCIVDNIVLTLFQVSRSYVRGDLSKSVTASQRTKFLLQTTIIIGCLVWFGSVVGILYSKAWYIIIITFCMSGNEFSILKIDKSLCMEIKQRSRINKRIIPTYDNLDGISGDYHFNRWYICIYIVLTMFTLYRYF